MPLSSAPRILVADDEKMIARMWQIILSSSGFDVAICFDGLEALESARVWRPHVFLTDLAMPRLDGIDAALRVRRLLPGCRIIILSASSEGCGDVELIRKQQLEYLQKPVAPATLLETIRALLATEEAVRTKMGPGRVTLPTHALRRRR